MATKTIHRRLSDAELNAPDLDDEGNLDVEYFPIPSGSGIENPELKAAWDEAIRILSEQRSGDPVAESFPRT
jgi:hypothetical protein